MDSPKRVLVFPAGTEIGLELHRSLAFCKDIHLIGASSVTEDHANYVYSKLYDLSHVTSSTFARDLCDFVTAERVDVIFPAHDEVIAALATWSSPSLPVVGSGHNTIMLCRDKRQMYAFLRDAVPLPLVHAVQPDSDAFPVFMKPAKGQGSRGCFLAADVAEWRMLLEKDPSLVTMEYLPGAEYTVDCFTNRHGALQFVGPRMRRRITNGIATNTVLVHLPEADFFASSLNEKFGFRGAWFFQLKQDSQGTLRLMEIGTRIAGSSGIHRLQNVNLALLTFYDFFDVEVAVCPFTQDLWRDSGFHGVPPSSIRMDRALQSAYRFDLTYSTLCVDFDDCLYRSRAPGSEPQVDPLIVRLVFDCHNQGKTVILLTKHAGPLLPVLKELRLSRIFDRIKHIPACVSKTAWIQSEILANREGAILIDDSYAERAVAIRAGIPAFAPDAVECLFPLRTTQCLNPSQPTDTPSSA